MRFAILSHANPQINKGGAELAALALFRGLREMGEDAFFISLSPSTSAAALWSSDPREIAISIQLDQYDYFYHIADLRTSTAVVETIINLKCDVVFAHHFLYIGVNSLYELKRRGVRVFLTLHELLFACYNHGQMVTTLSKQLCNSASPSKCVTCFPSKIAAQFATRESHFRSLLSSLDGLIAPSRFLISRLGEFGAHNERILVQENGVSALTPDNSIDRRGERFIFGYFGQITPFKGIDVLMDAIEIILERELGNSVEFRIHGNLVGLSKTFEDRIGYICAAHRNVEFRGPYNHSDVFRLMQSCDYVVVPSRWWENSPLVIQEAFQAGRPPIVSSIGGMAEKVLDGENGIHFEVGDANDLADKILGACSRELFTKLTASMPPRISPSNMAQAYLDFAGVGRSQEGSPPREI